MQEDRLFEQRLAVFVSDILNSNATKRFDKLASDLGQDVSAVRKRFEQLEKDLKSIADGKVPVPPYPESIAIDFTTVYACSQRSFSPPPDSSGNKLKKKVSPMTQAELDKRKGVPWTEEEHKLFIVGLAKYGKGDWRSISRNVVVTRTPTQVASHAQKYFIRLQGMANRKEKRRTSVHDMSLQLATGHPVPGSVLPPPPPVPRPPPTFSEGPSPSSAQPFAAPPLPPRPASTPASTRGPTATEREDSESPDAMLMMIDDGFEDRARASHPHAAPSSRGVPVSSNMLGNGGTGGLMPGASGGGGGSAPSSFPSTTRHLMGPPPPPPLFSSGGGGGMGEEAGSPEGGAFNPAVPPRMLGVDDHPMGFVM